MGPILRKMAEKAGVVYSLTAGDEPGSIVELYRFAKALGFKIVAAAFSAIFLRMGPTVISHSTFIMTMCFKWSKQSREILAPISGEPVASTTAWTPDRRVAIL